MDEPIICADCNTVTPHMVGLLYHKQFECKNKRICPCCQNNQGEHVVLKKIVGGFLPALLEAVPAVTGLVTDIIDKFTPHKNTPEEQEAEDIRNVTMEPAIYKQQLILAQQAYNNYLGMQAKKEHDDVLAYDDYLIHHPEAEMNPHVHFIENIPPEMGDPDKYIAIDYHDPDNSKTGYQLKGKTQEPEHAKEGKKKYLQGGSLEDYIDRHPEFAIVRKSERLGGKVEKTIDPFEEILIFTPSDQKACVTSKTIVEKLVNMGKFLTHVQVRKYMISKGVKPTKNIKNDLGKMVRGYMGVCLKEA